MQSILKNVRATRFGPFPASLTAPGHPCPDREQTGAFPASAGDLLLELWDVGACLAIPAGELLSLVPPLSHPRILRYRKNADRLRTLLAELLLRRLLSEKLGAPPNSFEIRRDANGRPFLEGTPVYFSLSHAGNLCAAALAPCPVGVDVETNAVSVEIAAAFYAPGEADAPPAERLRLWTLKESLCKCGGIPLEEALRTPAADFPALGLSSFSKEVPDGWLSAVIKNPHIIFC